MKKLKETFDRRNKIIALTSLVIIIVLTILVLIGNVILKYNYFNDVSVPNAFACGAISANVFIISSLIERSFNECGSMILAS